MTPAHPKWICNPIFCTTIFFFEINSGCASTQNMKPTMRCVHYAQKISTKFQNRPIFHQQNICEQIQGRFGALHVGRDSNDAHYDQRGNGGI